MVKLFHSHVMFVRFGPKCGPKKSKDMSAVQVAATYGGVLAGGSCCYSRSKVDTERTGVGGIRTVVSKVTYAVCEVQRVGHGYWADVCNRATPRLYRDEATRRKGLILTAVAEYPVRRGPVAHLVCLTGTLLNLAVLRAAIRKRTQPRFSDPRNTALILGKQDRQLQSKFKDATRRGRRAALLSSFAATPPKMLIRHLGDRHFRSAPMPVGHGVTQNAHVPGINNVFHIYLG